MRVLLRGVQIGRGVRRVSEGTGGQDRELPRVPVLEGDRHAAGRQAREAVDRVGREARLSLFAVGDDGRAGLLETPDRVEDGVVEESLEFLRRDLSGGGRLHPFDERRGAGNAADRFGG